jgi:hypothetical protein
MTQTPLNGRFVWACWRGSAMRSTASLIFRGLRDSGGPNIVVTLNLFQGLNLAPNRIKMLKQVQHDGKYFGWAVVHLMEQ